MSLVYFVSVIELAVVFCFPIIMVHCRMRVEVTHTEMRATACLDGRGVHRPVGCRGSSVANGNTQQGDRGENNYVAHKIASLRCKIIRLKYAVRKLNLRRAASPQRSPMSACRSPELWSYSYLRRKPKA